MNTGRHTKRPDRRRRATLVGASTDAYAADPAEQVAGLDAYHPPAVDYLRAECWCGRVKELWIPQRLIAAGRTLACGRPRCASPDGDRTPGTRERPTDGTTTYQRPRK